MLALFFFIFLLVLVIKRKFFTEPEPSFAYSSKEYEQQQAKLAAQRGAGAGAAQEAQQPTGHPITVLFGSQTGNAEGFALRLEEEAGEHGFHAKVVDLDEYDEENELAYESVVVFVLATYGEGDPTDSATRIYDYLQSKEREATSFRDVRYTVFGLGNRQYERFNEMGYYFDRRMEELGGTRVHELGVGDDNGSLEDDFVTWKQGLWTALRRLFNEEDDSSDVIDDPQAVGLSFALPYPVQWRYEMTREGSSPDETDSYDHPSFNASRLDSKHRVVHAPITVNRELHSELSDRSCRHIEIDVSGVCLKYETGDHLGVFPENDPELVDRLLKRVGEAADSVISFRPRDERKKMPFPCPCTARTALARYTDINALPSKGAILGLASLAKNDKERRKLFTLASKEGKDTYDEEIAGARTNIVELLEEFPSVDITLAEVLELVPRLSPRYYSISSSSTTHPNSVHITVSIVTFPRRSGVGKGVTSTFLSLQKPGSRIPVFIRRSTFKMPADPGVPIIMVGPGTGLAPFRGFVQERREQLAGSVLPGPSLLLFGCRDRKVDFIYREELEKAQKDGALSNLITAFSREQKHKVYVQNKLEEEEIASEVVELLRSKGAYFYVCGLVAMGRDVKASLQKVLGKTGMSETEAAKYITFLQHKGRYLTDLWS